MRVCSKLIFPFFLSGYRIVEGKKRYEKLNDAAYSALKYRVCAANFFINDGYPYYSLRTRSLDDFAKCLDWHARVGWLRNATRVSDGSEVWVEILESTWYIHELTDELIPAAYAYCEENGIEIQQD